MKIVFLIDGLGFGGAQRQLVNLAVEFKKSGYEVEVLRYYEDNFYIGILSEYEITPITVNASNSFLRMFKIRRKIRELRPNVLISFMGTPNFYGAIASLGWRTWFFVASERIADEALFVNRKPKLLRCVISKVADAIVSNSNCAKELWEKYNPNIVEKLTTIYNIVDIKETYENQFHDGNCKVLIAARYEKEKNLVNLLKAVLLLSDAERQKLEIHWYGNENIESFNGSILKSGKHFVNENHLNSTIFLHDATEQIHARMSEADFVALFSLSEGLPNAIIEGMQLKKPIIMSTVSDYKVLVDKDNGFCCNPRSVEDIASVLRSAIYTSSKQRQAMGQCSYDKVWKICSKEKVVKQWQDLLVNLLKNNQ